MIGIHGAASAVGGAALPALTGVLIPPGGASVLAPAALAMAMIAGLAYLTLLRS